MYCVILALVLTTGYDADAEAAVRVALALAAQKEKAPRPPVITESRDEPKQDDYAALRARALAENKLLVVWVGVKHSSVQAGLGNCLHYHCESFHGAAAGVVVGVPRGGELYRHDLPGAPTVDRIQAVVRPPAQQFQSAPVYFRPVRSVPTFSGSSSGGC